MRPNKQTKYTQSYSHRKEKDEEEERMARRREGGSKENSYRDIGAINYNGIPKWEINKR